MEQFKKALDALQRESRELITAVQEAMIQALLRDDIAPAHIALVLAQRFSAERIAFSFPVICFLDAILKEAKSLCVDPKRTAFFITIGQEFLTKLAPSLFINFHASPQVSPMLRDRVLRVLKRWSQAELLNEKHIFCLTRAVELGMPLSHSSSVKGTDIVADVNAVSVSKATMGPSGLVKGDLGVASDQIISNRDHTAMREVFTRAQAQSFRSILHQCVLIMEQLPSRYAQPYVELIRNENFHQLTAAALAFSKNLLEQLKRDLRFAKGSQEPIGSNTGDLSSSTAALGMSSVADASCIGARNTLSQLLYSMSLPSADEEQDDGHGLMSITSTSVSRYKSPFLTDTFQQHSLVERTGFGDFRRRHHGDGALAAFRTEYYPRKEATVRRPFRIPSALQTGGGAVRCWFLSPSQWVNEKDVANLATFRGTGENTSKPSETTSTLGVIRKRERSE
ncbi:unnamed protein product [Phytomonas sp. EM1]|nr:unnamed protein product [Phytomonas sp. EM1]|eukprot:CCW63784.1 unnamed protein product [Phytomonas sp. isolate EM1]